MLVHTSHLYFSLLPRRVFFASLPSYVYIYIRVIYFVRHYKYVHVLKNDLATYRSKKCQQLVHRLELNAPLFPPDFPIAFSFL